MTRASLSALLTLTVLALPAGAQADSKTCHGERVTVRGTDGDDSHLRIRSGDVVALGDGNDLVVVSGPSRVTICGGQGDDTIYAGVGAGRDLLFDGEEGTDNVGSAWPGGPKAAAHPMRLYGGPASDGVWGGRADDVMHGGNGGDLLGGNGGDDRIAGQAGSDKSVSGGPGDDLLTGGRGDDNLFGAESFQRPSPPRGDIADCGAGRDYSNVRGAVSCEARDINFRDG